MASATDDVFRILVATDNHLGFAEQDADRGNDALETFEEILVIAQEKDVDFILLGGDLFHENKPSRQCIVRCMELLRRYTFGDKPVLFNFLSDPAENFKHSKSPTVNYMDPNLNVAIPVFSIHGNHDDPAGRGLMCALETLSSAGVINYFGRTNDLKNITISPVLLEKGRTKLALYGLSAIKDERLFRLFRENKVTMLRPKEDIDDWFNLLVVHQNRIRHGHTNYLPESFLDPFLHLVLWGHEHQCLIEPQQSAEDSFFVVQPGSSVATSLCAAEAGPKHIAILEINHEQQFKVTPIPLKTVRPFVFEDLCLADLGFNNVLQGKVSEMVQNVVDEEIKKMLDKATKLLSGHPKQPTKPLLRLRVEYTDEAEMFNTIRFGHRFDDKVANPNDIVLFRKQRAETRRPGDPSNEGVDEELMDNLFAEDVSEVRVEDLVEEYFLSLKEQNQQMSLLSERGMANAIRATVDKDDKDAISTIVQQQIKKTVKHLMKLDISTEHEVVDEVLEYRRNRLARQEGASKEEDQEAQEALQNPNRAKKRATAAGYSSFEDDIKEEEEEGSVATKKQVRGGASKGARGRARGQASTSRTQLTFEGGESPKKQARGRGSQGRGSAAGKSQTIKESLERAGAIAKRKSNKTVVYVTVSDSE